MRQKTFTAAERLVLIPVELVSALKWYMLILPAFFLLGGLGASSGFWNNALNHGLFAVLNLLAALAAGAVLTPVLLPWLPGRAFAQKGVIMGVIMTGVISVFSTTYLHLKIEFLEILAWFFLTPALSAYLAMNFTGSSTFTSLSGVRKEMRWAVPFEIMGGVARVDPLVWIAIYFLKVNKNEKYGLLKKCCHTSIQQGKMLGLRNVHGGVPPCCFRNEQRPDSNRKQR